MVTQKGGDMNAGKTLLLIGGAIALSIGVSFTLLARHEGVKIHSGAVPVERYHSDLQALRDDIKELRQDVKEILLRLPVKEE